MNPLKSQNIVAKVLQVYAYLNTVAGFILALAFAEEVVIAVVIAAVALVISFLIYALGEIIDLLERIKANTGDSQQAVVSDELPDL